MSDLVERLRDIDRNPPNRRERHLIADEIDRLRRELAEAQRDTVRLHKLYWLAAQDVIWFSAYDEKTRTWPDDHYTPCVMLNDTFTYASADGESLTDDQIDTLIAAYKQYGNDGVIAWASARRGAEPLPELQTVAYRNARAAMDRAEDAHADWQRKEREATKNSLPILSAHYACGCDMWGTYVAEKCPTHGRPQK